MGLIASAKQGDLRQAEQLRGPGRACLANCASHKHSTILLVYAIHRHKLFHAFNAESANQGEIYGHPDEIGRERTPDQYIARLYVPTHRIIVRQLANAELLLKDNRLTAELFHSSQNSLSKP
jgi:hypothetical protein